MTRYLTAEEILVLHAVVVEAAGGSHGVRDAGLLASLAHKPAAMFGGKQLYSGVFLKAAVLCEALANYHVFVDGNERTALIATARFLHLNVHEFAATNKEAERLILDIVAKKFTPEAIAKKLTQYSKRARS